MKIPHAICSNTLQAYTPFPKIRLLKKKTLHAEDLKEWDKYIPKRLTVICIEILSEHWIECGHPINLPLCSDSCLLLDLLPTTIPLEISVLKINEDIYWKRAHFARWPKSPPSSKSYSDVPNFRKNSYIFSSLSSIYSTSLSGEISRRSSKVIGADVGDKFDSKTWKEHYLERHLEEALENLTPENYEPEKIKELSMLCRNYVRCLKLKQLKSSGSSEIRDHIPLNAILSSLCRLREFCLCFKQTYVGDNFSWHVFKTSPNDVNFLAQGIKKCHLTVLKLQNSDIDCHKVVTIMKAFEKNETLRLLDFSHCKISDRGVLGIAKIILEHPTIETLILTNNNVGANGAEVLSYVIKQPNCKLQSLNLRLNHLGDNGGQFLINSCVREAARLKSLCLSGCGLTRNVENLGKMLAFNCTLEQLDVSNNRLGEQIGQNILAGMEYNKMLISFDLRMCGISQETERKIKAYIHDNRLYIRMSFQEKGIVKLRKVVKFKEFLEEENKPVRSTRDVASEIDGIFE